MTDLSREARSILDAAAGADDPTAADKARVHEAVMTRIGAAPPVAAATSSSLGLKALATALVIGALSVGGYLLLRPSPTSPTTAIAPAPETQPEPEPQPQPETAPETAPAPAPETQPEPAIQPGTTPAPARTPAPAADLKSLLAEKRLIAAARRALGKTDGAAALELLDQHQRRFPRGQLTAEREGTRVLALCALDRTETARTQGASFLRRYAKHPMAARVRASCAFASR